MSIDAEAERGIVGREHVAGAQPRRRRRGTWIAVVVSVVVVLIAGAVWSWRGVDTVRLHVSGAANGPDAWSAWPDSPLEPRFEHVLVATDSGIFVWGGNTDFENHGLRDGAFFDGSTRKWRRLPGSPLVGEGFAIGVWTGTDVVVVNGPDGDVRAAAFDPVSFTWRALPDLPIDHSPGQILAVDGTVVVIGVGDASGGGPLLWLDEAAETWRRGAPLPPGVGFISDFAAMGDRAVVAVFANAPLARDCGTLRLFTYRPASDAWAELPAGPAAKRSNPMLAWTGSELFVGGTDTCMDGHNDGSSYTADLLDPATGTWRAAASGPIGFKPPPRYGELWTGSSVALVQGNGSPLLYSPNLDSWHEGPTPLAPGQLVETPVVAFDGWIVITGGASWMANPDCCTFSIGTYAYRLPAGY